MELERRFIQSKVVRTGGRKDQKLITGYAAVYRKFSENLGGFRERIEPGTFSDYLDSGGDVVALFNHQPNLILGRRRSGTLRLYDDPKRGLRFVADLPDTSVGQGLWISIGRGDVSQCSFSFIAREDEWTEEQEPSDPGRRIAVRILKKADLLDVAPVTYPAYPDTSCDARALFPDGIPNRIRWHVPLIGDSSLIRTARDPRKVTEDNLSLEVRNADECLCRCPACFDGECDECSEELCEDSACALAGCPMQSRERMMLRLAIAL